MFISISKLALEEITKIAIDAPKAHDKWANLFTAVHISLQKSLHAYTFECGSRLQEIEALLTAENMQQSVAAIAAIKKRQYANESAYEETPIKAQIVSQESKFELTYDQGSDSYTWSIPWTMASDIIPQTPIILGENYDDAEFWDLAAAQKSNHFVYTRLGGGGSTTSATIKAINRTSENLTLCLVDSDKKDHDRNAGDTAKHAIEAGGIPESFAAVKMYDARTIENMIPSNVYDLNRCDNYRDSLTLRRKMIELQIMERQGLSSESVWRFYPVKNGLSKKNELDVVVYDHWKTAYLNNHIEELSIEEDQLPSPCKKLLQAAIEYLKKNDCREFNFISDAQKQEFQNICNLVTAFSAKQPQTLVG